MQRQAIQHWKREMAQKVAPVIMETGTLQWEGTVHSNYRRWAEHGTWIGSDITAGSGVDLVADLHRVHEGNLRRFDGIFCAATLEHLERPWVAMHSMAKSLAVGGSVFVQTHQTFPLHGYPNDFFRFSTEALRVLMEDAGLEVMSTDYSYPCSIHPGPGFSGPWDTVAESFLNVNACGRRNI